MTLEEYVEEADRRSDADFRDPENEKWFGVRGGRYADFLASWNEAFGERLRVLFFEELLARPADVLGDVADFLEISPMASRAPICRRRTAPPASSSAGSSGSRSR